MRNTTIRGALAIILLFALGLGALKNADTLWAASVLLATLAVIGVAVIGALTRTGRPRFWWTGFAVFAGGYLVVTFVPVISMGFGPRLITTKALEFIQSQLTMASALPQVLWQQHARALATQQQLESEGKGPGDPGYDAATGMLRSLQNQLPRAGNHVEFIRIGQCFIALMSGIVGGLIGLRFHGKETS
jgi:hypothetical protein